MSVNSIIRFVDALFLVYYILIIVRIIFSWIGIPSGALLQIYKFVYDVTEPYLGIFRRIIPSVGVLDFSPCIAIIVLRLIQSIVDQLIASFV